jgi:TRAP-type mannitol/chloroaromatic compound transport system permease small subunit
MLTPRPYFAMVSNRLKQEKVNVIPYILNAIFFLFPALGYVVFLSPISVATW